MTGQTVELPPLPETDHTDNGDCFGHEALSLFTAKQMRAYALLAVEAERERCAGLCEKMLPSGTYDPGRGIEERAFADCAATIRNSKG